MKALLQVIFGFHLFFSHRRGCHFIANFACRSSDILQMCPANLTLRSAAISCRSWDCALLITSSFVIWSRYDIFKIFRQHLWWKTSNFFEIAAVDFQVPLALRVVGSTIVLYSCSFIYMLMEVNEQIFWSFWKKKHGFAFDSIRFVNRRSTYIWLTLILV